MTSPAKQRANRRNAEKSTGPKTAAGKARAARNSRRHGLTLPVLADPALSPEIDTIARTIETSLLGRAAGAHGHHHACEIADAIIDLRRVREVKLPLIGKLEADLSQASGPLRELVRLDRYEHRAFTRRNRAIREFCAAMAPPAPPPACKTNPTEKTQ
jgi:hypothetical protein